MPKGREGKWIGSWDGPMEQNPSARGNMPTDIAVSENFCRAGKRQGDTR
jgi:hypothetical protein